MYDWKECSPLEAHQAFVAGAHDVEVKPTTHMELWQFADGVFREDGKWKYRIREKPKMITVEIPCPKSVIVYKQSIGITFETQAQCETAALAWKIARGTS